MNTRTISEAFYLAAQALAHKCGNPLPQGISSAEVGDWELAINNGKEPARFKGHSLSPFEVYAAHKEIVCFALFGPYEGMIGGLPESTFIADMNAAGYSA